MKLFSAVICVSAIALVFASTTSAGLSETWNTAGSENGWHYFEERLDKTLLREKDDGVDYAYCPLVNLGQWLDSIGEDYYPLYSFGNIDLATEPLVSMDIKFSGTTDLSNRTLAFFIGEWNNDTGTKAFYRQEIPITITQNWQKIELNVYQGTWQTMILGDGDQPTPEELYTNPQKWGFGIYGGSGTPGSSESKLCFDNFANTTPEPTVLTLLGVGGVAVLRRRRRA